MFLFNKGLSLIGGAILLGSSTIGAVVASQDFQYDLGTLDSTDEMIDKYGDCTVSGGICYDFILLKNQQSKNGAMEDNR